MMNILIISSKSLRLEYSAKPMNKHKFNDFLSVKFVTSLRGCSERPLRAKRFHIRGMLSFSICNPLLERQGRQYSTVTVSLHLFLIYGFLNLIDVIAGATTS